MWLWYTTIINSWGGGDNFGEVTSSSNDSVAQMTVNYSTELFLYGSLYDSQSKLCTNIDFWDSFLWVLETASHEFFRQLLTEFLRQPLTEFLRQPLTEFSRQLLMSFQDSFLLSFQDSFTWIFETAFCWFFKTAFNEFSKQLLLSFWDSFYDLCEEVFMRYLKAVSWGV